MKKLITILALSIALPAAAEEPDRLKEAAALIFSGRAVDARTKLREAQGAYRTAKDDLHDAIASLLMGVTDIAAKDSAAAKSDLEYASRKLEAIHDPLGAWFALLLQAEVESENGQFAAAIALHERSLAMIKELSDPAKQFSLEGMRALVTIFGVPPEYVEMLTKQPLVARMFFLPFAESMTRDNYGVALMELGELTKADAELQRAAQTASLFGGMFDSSIQAHIGDLRRRQWKLDEARESYMKALQSVQQLQAMPLQTDSLDVAIYGKLAELELVIGRTDDALAWNDKSLVRSRGDEKRKASLLQERGNLLMRGSRFGDAEVTLNEALQLAKKVNEIYLEASILADLGALDLFRGAYGKSATRLEKAIALFDQVDAGYEETPVFALLAEDYVLLEAPASVADVLKRGTELARRIKFPLAEALMKIVAASPQVTADRPLPHELQNAFEEWIRLPEAGPLLFNDDIRSLVRAVVGGQGAAGPVGATASLPALSAMADIAQGKNKFLSGDNAGARMSFLEGLKKNSSVDLRSGYLAGIGATYLREGNYDEAIPYLEQAVATLETTAGDIKVQDQLAGYLGSGRHWYFDLLIEMLLRKKRIVEAFDYTERARARAFLQLVGNARLNATRGADPALTAEAEQLRLQLASLASAGAPAMDLEEKRREYEGLMLRVKTSNPEYAALTKVDTLSLDAIRAELPPDTTLISYFVTPFAMHAWVIDRDSSTYVPLGGNREALHATLCWADDFERTGDAVRGTESLQNPCTGRRASADEAFDLLIAPLKSRIKDGRLILVPHGQLHYIPFAALLDPASGKYLIEEYVLSYAPSASALRFLRGKESPARGKALVLGDPDSTERALPGASCEAVSVSGDLGVTPLLGARATESVLHHLDGKIDLLHIATHAGFNAVNPLFSGISLAKDSEQDGILEVHEILADLDLTGVNLIVLSACSTALGARSGGDEIVGLTRALLYAGTPSVISTLWDINDQASASLMEEFYRRLRLGERAADALRGAQITMLRDPNYSHPMYWAAFNLTGDPLVRWK